MEARALGRIVNLPVAQRWEVLAEGAAHLVEHVATLRDDVAHLIDAGRPRSAAIANAVAAEEAAKVLIILDLARLGWRRPADHLLRAFSSHLARGIYVDVAEASYATMREVREAVDRLRASHYLDGPNDVDWVFRNQIESRREELFYVDYVYFEEEGGRWISPEDGASLVPIWAPSGVLDLIAALNRMGLLTSVGLQLVAGCWREVEMQAGDKREDFGTHWAEISRLNREVLEHAWEQTLSDVETGEADWSRIIDRWSFPLYDLDLQPLRVQRADLEAQRAWVTEQMNREMYGIGDEGW